MGEFDHNESYQYRWEARPQKLFVVSDSVLSMGKWHGSAAAKGAVRSTLRET